MNVFQHVKFHGVVHTSNEAELNHRAQAAPIRVVVLPSITRRLLHSHPYPYYSEQMHRSSNRTEKNHLRSYRKLLGPPALDRLGSRTSCPIKKHHKSTNKSTNKSTGLRTVSPRAKQSYHQFRLLPASRCPLRHHRGNGPDADMVLQKTRTFVRRGSSNMHSAGRTSPSVHKISHLARLEPSLPLPRMHLGTYWQIAVDGSLRHRQ